MKTKYCLRNREVYFYHKKCQKAYPFVGFLLGIIIFVFVYGVNILNPFYVDWLLGGSDLSQHYLGWEFYRNDVWRFPIGMTNRLAYPIETSVVFTDSIPILAVFFKIFSGFLPRYFQYFGLWGILCFGLQGYYAGKIFSIWDINYRCSIIGEVILITAPIMLYRMFMHTSLGAQWLILVAIYLFFKHDSQCEYSKKEIIYWGILGFLIAGIHLYFFPMCFLFVAGGVAKSIIKNKKLKPNYMFPIICFIVGTCYNFYVLGGFASHASKAAEGLGDYGCNLNSFINGNGFSRILPSLKLCEGQREGFAYLGLGVICMCAICMLICFFKIHTIKVCEHDSSMIIVCICIISLLVSVLPTVTYGEKILFDIQLPKKVSELFSVFRANGRFIWPVWYLLTLYCIKIIANLSHIKGSFINVCILGICMVIQIFDISQAMISRHETFAKEVRYEYVNDDFWERLSEYRNFRCVCFSYPGESVEYSTQIGALALKYNWVMNAFYFAREIDGVRDNEETLKYENPKYDCIYVFLPEQQETLKDLENELRYYRVGELVIGVTWLDDGGNVNDFSYEMQ